jgi:hypothetical protein
VLLYDSAAPHADCIAQMADRVFAASVSMPNFARMINSLADF